MKKNRKNLRRDLVARAKKLVAEGYSVIPILGDASASEPKKPSRQWRGFQKRIAGSAEIDALFDDRALALGVVCGQVSQLLVIDFDDHLRYQRFCRHLPQYAETYTVKTRRGYHLYFRTGEKVPTHQFDGGDIKGEKSYVVAPPSVIGGFKYESIKGCGPASLDRASLDCILNYFQVGSVGAGEPLWAGDHCPKADIRAMYRRLSKSVGRNNALYRCASLARRDGLSRQETELRLLGLHIEAAGSSGQRRERRADRVEEGRRTITSAFAGVGSGHVAGEGIPNSVRECLLRAQGSASVARLLDILCAEGWLSERYFRMKDAIDVCGRYGMNRKSVMAALTGEHSIFNGRQIIARRYVEYLDSGGLKSGKRGRPVQLLFQAPSVGRLLGLLGVSWTPSDDLGSKDLSSGHAYRRALHREYVKRLSPAVPMAVLAERIGVSARTLRRYNSQLGVHVSQRVGRFGLTWESLQCLPRLERGWSKRQTPGYWLAHGDGSRLPAWRHIGAGLLRRGVKGLQVCARLGSILSLGSAGVRPEVYEALSRESFLRLRLLRGGRVDRGGLLDRLRRVARGMSARVSRMRYAKVRLVYDTVSVHIAEDKVAETIGAYLVAEDDFGAEVRRPARRGVAYRMLKEFGEGNVLLAVRDSYGETLAAMARHALGAGDVEAGAVLLAGSMA